MSKNSNFLFKLDLLILSVLKKEDHYGYEITKLISNLTNGVIVPKQGTMYPILHELLEVECISSNNVVVGNKIRVYYHLEDKGRERLKILISNYDELVNSLNYIVHEYGED